MRTLRLGLCIPSLHTWDADFALCVATLCLTMAKVPVPGFAGQGLSIHNRRGSLVAKLRQELLQDAIDKHCTHALFIDSDQTFPSDLAHRLLGRKKQFIGCNVATKLKGNSIPTARQRSEKWWGGDRVYSNGRTDCEKIWRLGFGVMMIDLDVMKKVPKPWFDTKYLPEANEYVGEDWFFCELMEEHGIELWCDHDVSQEIGHNGTWQYGHDEVVDIPQVNEIPRIQVVK